MTVQAHFAIADDLGRCAIQVHCPRSDVQTVGQQSMERGSRKDV